VLEMSLGRSCRLPSQRELGGYVHASFLRIAVGKRPVWRLIATKLFCQRIATKHWSTRG
jgi:hypothetical protein